MNDEYPPCKDCILYAICRTALINMDEKYVRVAHLSRKCILLHKFLYEDAYIQEIIKRRELTWKLFNIKRRDSELEI